MEPKLEGNVDEYLPLDVVFKTLQAAILRGELKPRAFDGDQAGQ